MFAGKIAISNAMRSQAPKRFVRGEIRSTANNISQTPLIKTISL